MQHIRRRPRLPLQQLDLWLASPLPELGEVPRWSALPDQTQRTLAGLLTGLLMAELSMRRSNLRRHVARIAHTATGQDHRTGQTGATSCPHRIRLHGTQGAASRSRGRADGLF
jgi:hypothetical protein